MTSHKFNYIGIRYFLVVAKFLNFTQAAKSLYISQPALSKQIRVLEEELGFQLLERNTKGVKLTEGGTIMYAAWEDMFRRQEVAIEEARKANQTHVSKIRVGLLEASGVIDIIMPKIAQFNELYPDIEIELVTMGFVDLKERLRKHELDLIFSFSAEVPGQKDNVEFRLLQKLELNIIIPKKNHLYTNRRCKISDLKDETFYVLGNTYSDYAKRNIVEHCKKLGFYPAKMKNFPNVTSLAVALSSSDGVSIGYKEFFTNTVGDLKFFRIEEEIGRHYIVFAWNEEKRPLVNRMIEYFSLELH